MGCCLSSSNISYKLEIVSYTIFSLTFFYFETNARNLQQAPIIHLVMFIDPIYTRKLQNVYFMDFYDSFQWKKNENSVWKFNFFFFFFFH